MPNTMHRRLYHYLTSYLTFWTSCNNFSYDDRLISYSQYLLVNNLYEFIFHTKLHTNTHTHTENLLDSDQNDEIQANAAELLANVSRYNGEFTAQYFDDAVMDSLVLMCASPNTQVRRHAPLVLGLKTILL